MNNILRIEDNVKNGKGGYNISHIEDEPDFEIKKEQPSSQSEINSDTDFYKHHGISRE